jgi:hypothetical protein
MHARGVAGWLVGRVGGGFACAGWRSRWWLVVVLAAVLAPVASAQRLGEAEARFAWPRGVFAGEAPPEARTPVELEMVGEGADAELHVTIRTLREMEADGSPLVWNRSAVYRYSWVDRGALFLAVPEDVDVDYGGLRVEAFDKVLGSWVGLGSPVVERADRGPWLDVVVELFDRVSGLAAGPVLLAGQVALELAALGDVAEGRIDVAEVVPPLEGGFVDPNDFDLVSLRFLEPLVAVEYPSGSAGVSRWYSASDVFDLRFDPTMEVRFVVPVGGAAPESLARVEAWLVFVQHYASWRASAASASVVGVVPHALLLRPVVMHDAFADALVLVGEAGNVLVSSVGASRESGEPVHAGNRGGASVWFGWVAPGDGSVVVDTFGSGFDTLLAVYQGSDVAGLRSLAANDDAGGGAQSEVRVEVVGGERYWIAVDGYGGEAGEVALSWRMESRSSAGVPVVPGSGAGASGFELMPSYVRVSNVGLAAERGGVRRVSFDVAWDESWRGPDRPSWVAAADNWDAAWVFVKYRVDGGAWRHATLAGGGHVAPAGSVVDVSSDRVGAFIYRSSSG